MQSQTVVNRITMFGETVDADGKPVLAAVELSPQNKQGEVMDFAERTERSSLLILPTSCMWMKTKKEPITGSNCSGSNCLHESPVMVLLIVYPL